jgi:hypothetical protein
LLTPAAAAAAEPAALGSAAEASLISSEGVSKKVAAASSVTVMVGSTFQRPSGKPVALNDEPTIICE